MTVRWSLVGLAAGVALLAGGCSGGGHPTAASPQRLDGEFRLAAGACSTGKQPPTGSYLVVISAAADHTVRNPHGGCRNASYTLLRPGTDGGLVTGEFQEVAGATFDARRNSRQDRIIEPVRFGKLALGFATSAYDEQAAANGAPAFPRPAAIRTASGIQVDLRSLVVSYGGPAGATCRTSLGIGCWQLGSENATGTYNPATGAFAIDWFSGESFVAKGDSIEVHLAGTFVPRSG